MLHTWFECKIRYEKVMENGMQKKVTEPYLVDSLSFTEAESRIIEEITPFISGEFTVAGIKRANYSEIVVCGDDSADRFFKCKLAFITLDEKSGSEKRTFSYILVQAADLRDAVRKLDESMKETLDDYCIVSVSETSIMDVYPYEEAKVSTNEKEDNAPAPVCQYIASLPAGSVTKLCIAGKDVFIDKTSDNVKVIPDNGSDKP